MATTTSKAKPSGNGEANGENLFGPFLFPHLDMGTALANQRKTMAALVQINDLALTGAQEMQRHQAELMRETVDEFAAMFADLMQPAVLSPDWVEKQTESSQKALARTLASAREISDVLAKTQTAAFGIWSQRLSEGLSSTWQH